MKRALPFLACLCLVGAGPATKNPAAASAEQRYAVAEKKATDAYNQAMSAATKQLVEELKKARAEVMKSGSADALAEANAIDAAIKDAEGRLAQSSAKSVNIMATKGWQEFGPFDSGTYQVTASGRWRAAEGAENECGPEGLEKKVRGIKGRPGALLARADGQDIEIGTGGKITLATAGPIAFRMNDTDSGTSDNSGQIKVTIQRN